MIPEDLVTADFPDTSVDSLARMHRNSPGGIPSLPEPRSDRVSILYQISLVIAGEIV
jgi:hypothetical protein